jgi:hypothetical protein
MFGTNASAAAANKQAFRTSGQPDLKVDAGGGAIGPSSPIHLLGSRTLDDVRILKQMEDAPRDAA